MNRKVSVFFASLLAFFLSGFAAMGAFAAPVLSPPDLSPPAAAVEASFGLKAGDATWLEEPGHLQAQRFLNTAGTGTITTIRIKFNQSAGAGNVMLGVYSDASGVPGRLLGWRETAAGAGWVSVSGFSIQVTANTYYWLAFSLQSHNNVEYLNGQASGSHVWGYASYGSMPEQFPGIAFVNNTPYVMTAVVSVGEDAGSPALPSGSPSESTAGLAAGGATWREEAGHLQAQRFLNDRSSVVTGLQLKFSQASASGKVMMGIYSDAGGKPDKLLGWKEAEAGTGWVSVTGLNVPLAANTYYWLAFNLEDDNTVEYLNGQAAGSHVWGYAAYGSMPSTFPPVSFVNNTPYVMKAVFAEASAPDAPGSAITNFGLESGDAAWREEAGHLQAQRFLNDGGSVVTGLELKFNQNSASGRVMLGIYSDAGGKPNKLLGWGETAAGTGWVSISGLNVPLAENTYYWLAFNLEKDNTVEYLNGQGAGSHVWGYAGYGSMPSIFPPVSFVNNTPYVMRAVFSEAPSSEPAITNFGLESGDATWREEAGHLQAQRLFNPGQGVLSALELKFNQASAAGKVMLGIYSDANGSPGTLLGCGETAAGTGWVNVSGLNVPLTANTYYWLAFNLEKDNTVEYLNGQAAGSHVWGYAGYGPMPSAFPPISFVNNTPYVMTALVSYEGPPQPVRAILGLEAGDAAWREEPGHFQAQRYLADESGTLTSLRLKFNQPQGSGLVTLAVYADVSGVPGALLAWNETKAGAGWVSAPINLTVTANTYYWLAFNLEKNNTVEYQTGMAPGCHVWGYAGYGTPPAAFPSIAFANNAPYVMEAMSGRAVAFSVGLNNGDATWREEAGHLQAQRFLNACDGVIGALELEFNQASAAGKVMLGIYSDANGSPGVLLGYGETGAGQGWVRVSGLSVPARANTYYWLAFNLENDNTVEYLNGQGVGSHVWGYADYGPMPSAFPPISFVNNTPYVMRAEVLLRSVVGFGLNKGDATYPVEANVWNCMRLINHLNDGTATGSPGKLYVNAVQLFIDDPHPEGTVRIAFYEDAPFTLITREGAITAPVSGGWVTVLLDPPLEVYKGRTFLNVAFVMSHANGVRAMTVDPGKGTNQGDFQCWTGDPQYGTWFSPNCPYDAAPFVSPYSLVNDFPPGFEPPIRYLDRAYVMRLLVTDSP